MGRPENETSSSFGKRINRTANRCWMGGVGDEIEGGVWVGV